MTGLTHCPHCGADLHDDSAAAVRASAPAATSTWETLREAVAPPRSIAELMAHPEATGPAWWLPSLLYLAYRTTDDAEARAVLDEFASRRDELFYAVVEEQTDDVFGLTLQPWPLVDERGRLRFPIGTDPVEVEVVAGEVTTLLEAARARWNELGLLQEDLVGRRLQIGDVYAVDLADKPNRSRIPVLPHGDEPPRYLGGLAARREEGAVAVPVVDITWDAREAGKLAHYAAAAGVIPEELGAAPTAMAAVARETEERYMIGFARGMDPRDVPPGSQGGA